MGKTTLFHPVSLHVIRGASEYCGFRIGRLKQIKANPESGTAHYAADLTGFPFDPESHSLTDIRKAFQQCFMRDIKVYYLIKTRAGNYVAGLAVKLVKRPWEDAESNREVVEEA